MLYYPNGIKKSMGHSTRRPIQEDVKCIGISIYFSGFMLDTQRLYTRKHI